LRALSIELILFIIGRRVVFYLDPVPSAGSVFGTQRIKGIAQHNEVSSRGFAVAVEISPRSPVIVAAKCQEREKWKIEILIFNLIFLLTYTAASSRQQRPIFLVNTV
jgi:hypothetical protein